MAVYSHPDPDLGIIYLHLRRNNTQIKASWHEGHVRVLASPYVPQDQVLAAIERMKPRLLAIKPRRRFGPGEPLVLDCGLTFHFTRGREDDIVGRLSADGAEIRVGERYDFDDTHVQGTISNILKQIARRHAPKILIPEGVAEASRLALSPRRWEISRGYRTLGHCSSSKVIALSAACIFLPADLRKYVICHELAHLTEMNHSPRFHALLDAYLSGQEQSLNHRLNHFDWPIMR